MAYNDESAHWQQQLISRLDRDIDNRFDDADAGRVKSFVRAYFAQYPLEDVREWPASDIAAYVSGLWRFFSCWSVESGPCLALFNGDALQLGWHSAHTELWILQRDMPFLQDSVRLLLDRSNIVIHSIYSHPLLTERDADGSVIAVDDYREDCSGCHVEALLCLQIGRLASAEDMQALEMQLRALLDDVAVCTADFPGMQARLSAARQVLSAQPESLTDTGREVGDFIDWLADGHFIFLGYRYFAIGYQDADWVWQEQSHLRQGLFCHHGDGRFASGRQINDGVRHFLESRDLLSLSRSSHKSHIHRSGYFDYVAIKDFDETGVVRGKHYFMGLYTSKMYSELLQNIPLLRQKFSDVFEQSHLHPRSHDGKALLQIMQTLPRDEWLMASCRQLLATATGVLKMQERRRIRLFVHPDAYQRFVSCIVYLPKDLYSTDNCEKIQDVLLTAYAASACDVSALLSESVLAQVHFVLRIGAAGLPPVELDDIEASIVRAVTIWSEGLHQAASVLGTEDQVQALLMRYRQAFPAGYRALFSPSQAVRDMQACEALLQDDDVMLSLGELDNATPELRIIQRHQAMELSSVMPVLENFGLRVISEQTFALQPQGVSLYLHVFALDAEPGDVLEQLAQGRQRFLAALRAVCNGDCENDRFNRLVLLAALNWRETSVVRAAARYLKQTGIPFSLDYIADTVVRHASLTAAMLQYFDCLFNPQGLLDIASRQQQAGILRQQLLTQIDAIASLDEDRILRRHLEWISAIRRTNFYQMDNCGHYRPQLAMKLEPAAIADMPQPVPMFEIFIYAPRVEGVHLRFGPVARGGLRWSDRLEDFRTEVLGLVKAQQVKNAVIVPVGAKGGFVVRQACNCHDRDALMLEVQACYRLFVSGLLQLTDNYRQGSVIPPSLTVRLDGDDPYLVVAADKGTASFSDLANAVAEEYGFWLGDAFASGGSQGYDHKKMGITARGAWVAVQRHFSEMGIDIRQQDFSCVGIGDMSGDVFGNGMLLSPHTRLLAAFDHRHIFLDPDPDPESSYQERQRLFALPKSSWDDYGKDLISSGGGVFSRTAKSIFISDAVRKVLCIADDVLTPAQLIQAILCAPVDLLWNGGIGTYIKSSTETHGDACDKTNDNVRVDADRLRAQVIGEGGNLGMTQRARVEYCLQGGRCNTDFIDNAGGVDCSDHEVNLKILFRDLVDSGAVDQQTRNSMLEAMTDEVANLVLQNNDGQALALSLALSDSEQRINEYARYMSALQHEGLLDRTLDFLPEDDVLSSHKQHGKGLTRPELAVLMARAKMQLKAELVQAPLAQDACVAAMARQAFPQSMLQDYGDRLHEHQLYREIVATQLANDIVNHMGITFAWRLRHSTTAQYSDIARAWCFVREVFDFTAVWDEMKALEAAVDAQQHMRSMRDWMRTARRAVRWFLRHRAGAVNVQAEIQRFAAPLRALMVSRAEILSQDPVWCSAHAGLLAAGISPLSLVYCSVPLHEYLGIIDVSVAEHLDSEWIANLYLVLGDTLQVETLKEAVAGLPVDSQWQAQAREVFLDDIESYQRELAVKVALGAHAAARAGHIVAEWVEHYQFLLQRWHILLAEIAAAPADYAICSVAVRELHDMVLLSGSSSYVAGARVA